jgi:hypothetical protein
MVRVTQRIYVLDGPNHEHQDLLTFGANSEPDMDQNWFLSTLN